MLQEYRRQARLMGSAFEFTIVTDAGASTAQTLLNACVGEVQRIEILLTEFSADAVTAQINRQAGTAAVAVPEEVFQLIRRCCDISRLSRGAFDITAAGLKKAYRFSNGPGHWPSAAELAPLLEQTGWQKIRLRPPGQVFLEKKGVKIGFGGIGKGYAADRVRKILVEKGVHSGVINASGDLTAWGQRPDGQSWKIGIADPDRPENILLWLPVHRELCMATSGNYEQYFEFEGKRYSHTIDPRNGRPVQAIKSVTVLSPSAELSDALATAVTVLGIDDGLRLLNQLPATFCLMVDAGGRVFSSENLNINYEKTA